MRKKIYYIGNSYRMAEILLQSKEFELTGLICEKKKAGKELGSFSCEHSMPVYKVDTKQDIINIVSQKKILLAVMYSFGIIIPQKVIDNIQIFNFHPGSLKTNRGSSPTNWSILLNEKETVMSLYEITEGIDEGRLVAEKTCSISASDTPSSLCGKMEQFVPSMLQELDTYLNENKTGKLIRGGIYRPRLIEQDYTINIEGDSIECIQAKIRSQIDYKGAIVYVKNQKYYVRSLEELKAVAPAFKISCEC